jgi:ABC-type transport system involved in multi-copper enzyme maturation permease subunit
MAALFWFTIRQSLRLRKLWFVLLVLVGPCALALLIRHFEVTNRLEDVWKLYHIPMLFLFFMIGLPMVCMLYGSSLIGSEVDGRTLGYLTTRRMRRETVLLVRFAAGWLLLTVLAQLAVAAFHLCNLVGSDIDRLNAVAGAAGDRPWEPWRDLFCYLRVVPFAVAAFLAVFTLLSLILRRPLIISLAYLVFLEMVVSNAPLKAQIYTITHQLRQMLKVSIPNLLDAFPPFRSRAVIESLYPPGATGSISLIIVVVAALALACVAMRTRELVPAKTGRD